MCHIPPNQKHAANKGEQKQRTLCRVHDLIPRYGDNEVFSPYNNISIVIYGWNRQQLHGASC